MSDQAPSLLTGLVISTTLATSSATSGMALLISPASTSLNCANAPILPRMSWLPRRTSSTNSRV
ncbi:hypothetical protein BN1708_006522 [Verticillium longisporum]|uniref:Uncharacterized protein n=1 Tax=Verticillium longisporum TaxID=100787 RepID=A0A0G4MKJ2_VERLO|nr:hypothetical protein BN1708_006522 [Verticillium longisporum]